ncbi:hypothetical protein SPRG_06867 [Saprolegnia parasitica CBS 223.65]|uniref:Uncharacterized protein n=1 Tax=Saprolegnia parasitica (strain CBS 223.65) TaxID=695850 RepID=A0A067CA13_SAPPC|nr:hypothetical protein SPRG_06867 [Saprolegnia parasitica CBS 223.65]KDO27599.1 hypothetical protein SPRG_06867 [Saprolegnia parasitica CBS 223.65]|eukprot:XP_012201722.1 hypothetical protein SPRG_06867 [Saprolegnia parasitica CBS 223.65]
MGPTSSPILSPVDAVFMDAAAPRRRTAPWRFVVGAVAVVGAICITVAAIAVHTTKVANHAADIVTQIQQSPGLRVTVTAKRPSMAFHGHMSTDIYIVPHTRRTTSALSFDAYMSLSGAETTDTYLLLDNRAYTSSVAANGTLISSACVTSGLPPVQLLQSSLADATRLDAVVGTDTTCDGDWLQLTFAGEAFVFCNGANHRVTHASGVDIDLSIEYLADPSLLPEFTIPVGVNSTTVLECPIVVSSATTSAASASMLSTASQVWTAATGAPRVATIESASCGCKMAKKPCLFVHGAGNYFNASLSDIFLFEWGLVHFHAPCCSSIKFAHFETWFRGWEEESLHDQFCDAALHVSKAKPNSTSIDNLLLVTFSMGNLVASGAVASGKCSFGRDLTWVSIAGPMHGSKTANALEQKCNANSGWDVPIKWLFSAVTLCPITNTFRNLQHKSSLPPALQAKYDAAQAVRRAHATKLICGTSPKGLTTIFSGFMQWASDQSNHGDVSDGLVAFESCSDGFGGFSTNYADGANYKPAVNHLDASFRSGDGWWGADRKPQKWFECAL